MSINYRKITQLIEEEILKISDQDLTQKQREKLSSLCEKIYRMESSIESTGSTKMIENIMSEIVHEADFLK